MEIPFQQTQAVILAQPESRQYRRYLRNAAQQREENHPQQMSHERNTERRPF